MKNNKEIIPLNPIQADCRQFQIDGVSMRTFNAKYGTPSRCQDCSYDFFKKCSPIETFPDFDGIFVHRG